MNISTVKFVICLTSFIIFASANADTSNTVDAPVTYLNLKSSESDLSNKMITIPPFYIGRMIFKANEKEDPFKLFLVNERGNLIERNINFANEDNFQTSNHHWNMGRYIDPIKTPNITNSEYVDFETSPSQIWKVAIPYGPCFGFGGNAKIHLFNNLSSKEQIILIPNDYGVEYCWNSHGWNPKKDLFYFETIQGASDTRNSKFFQLDPETKTLLLIGEGVSFDVRKDGHWCVWIDGYQGGRNEVDANGDSLFFENSQREVHLYNVDSNIDYRVTNDSSDNYFYKWADDYH